MENKVNKELRSQLRRLGMIILEKVRETELIEKSDKYRIANLVEDAYQALILSQKEDLEKETIEIFIQDSLHTLQEIENERVVDKEIDTFIEKKGALESLECCGAGNDKIIMDILYEATKKIESLTRKNQ